VLKKTKDQGAEETRQAFRFADELGPAKIIHIYEPTTALKAVVVVDNVAAGPSIGGVRMAPDATTEECFRLARAMTLKNAAAGLPHGGGKSVILADSKMPPSEKNKLIRAFACSIRDLVDYIPGPDMGTDERAMGIVKDEIGRAVGLPPEIGGIPLDEIGATGFGVSVAAEVAEDFCDLALKGARIAIQGFGSVGRHAARFLGEKGAVVVAVSDSRGSLADPDGLDIAALTALKQDGRSVTEHTQGTQADGDALIDADCDIWIPAARPDVITMQNVSRLRAKLVIQGANIPVTAEAENYLHEQGVLSIPDFIANAGGVICGAVEYRGGTQTTAMQAIEEKIRSNTRSVLQSSRESGLAPRQAAEDLALTRVRAAMALRRWS